MTELLRKINYCQKITKEERDKLIQRLIENGNPKNMKDFLKAFSEFIEKKEGERTEEEGQEPGE